MLILAMLIVLYFSIVRPRMQKRTMTERDFSIAMFVAIIVVLTLKIISC